MTDTDLEMQALNERLLRFVGFKLEERIDWHVPHWMSPDGGFHDIPNFLDPIWGIAHQVRWIWPKLDGIKVTIAEEGRYWMADQVFAVEIELRFKGRGFYRGSTLALAAAKAVEQLIDLT